MSQGGQNRTTTGSAIMSPRDFNLVLSIAMNKDVSETIYLDYLERYLYLELYQWKWKTIYTTCGAILLLFGFTMLMIQVEVLTPLQEITAYIQGALSKKD